MSAIGEGTLILLPSAHWKDWYHAKHEERARSTGNMFEAYFEEVMTRLHPDYVNPLPAGSLGDGGCDGARDGGRQIFACYGSRAKDGGERALAAKVLSDFDRALAEWPDMENWTFLTNAPFGPQSLKNLHSIQKAHRAGSARPIVALTWDTKRFWIEAVSQLPQEGLDAVFPGVPGSHHIELSDVIPLIASIASEIDGNPIALGELKPVEPTKLDYNQIPGDTRAELNSGRRLSPAINQWFASNADPELQDKVAKALTRIYEAHSSVTQIPKEIVERLYISIGGSNVRVSMERAECVFAITAYFFDRCSIFEEPPPWWGVPNAGYPDFVAEAGA